MADDMNILGILERRLARERAARMEAERLLEEKSEALYHSLKRTEASEALLQSALDSMADGLLLATPQGEIILASRLMEVIYPALSILLKPGCAMGPEFAFLLNNAEYSAVASDKKDMGHAVLDLTDGRAV